MSITNEIHKTFDEGKELRAVFLHISRAFDRVWHDGLLFKLSQIGIEGKALNIVKDFFKNGEQRIVIDGQSLYIYISLERVFDEEQYGLRIDI